MDSREIQGSINMHGIARSSPMFFAGCFPSGWGSLTYESWIQHHLDPFGAVLRIETTREFCKTTILGNINNFPKINHRSLNTMVLARPVTTKLGCENLGARPTSRPERSAPPHRKVIILGVDAWSANGKGGQETQRTLDQDAVVRYPPHPTTSFQVYTCT